MCIFINEKEGCLVDGKNGEIFRPNCFIDLVQYHSYLTNTNRGEEAHKLLKSVVKGERVIGDMIDRVKQINSKGIL